MLHLAAISASLLLSLAIQVINEGWKLEKSKHGIEVYTRIPEGGSIKEFRAVTTIESDIKTIQTLIEAPSNYPTWQANVHQAYFIESPESSANVMYVEMSMAWPMKNRYILLELRKVVEPSGQIRYSLQTSQIPYTMEEKLIRLNHGYGSWELNPLSDGSIEVISSFYIDPQTTVPDWLVNMFIIDGPYKMLSNMQKILNNSSQ